MNSHKIAAVLVVVVVDVEDWGQRCARAGWKSEKASRQVLNNNEEEVADRADLLKSTLTRLNQKKNLRIQIDENLCLFMLRLPRREKADLAHSPIPSI